MKAKLKLVPPKLCEHCNHQRANVSLLPGREQVCVSCAEKYYAEMVREGAKDDRA